MEATAWRKLLEDIIADAQERQRIAYVNTQDAQRSWYMSDLLLQLALGQLDPNHLGMTITIAHCMPPREPHTSKASGAISFISLSWQNPSTSKPKGSPNKSTSGSTNKCRQKCSQRISVGSGHT